MSKRLGATLFRELLPSSITSDPAIAASASALDRPLNALTRAIPALLLFARLANDSGMARPVFLLAPLERLARLSGGLQELPEAALDLLAWQFHVEGYAEAANVQAKREMIWQSVILHRKRGTPWAVRRGLEATLQMPAEVSEWFAYGGEPYFFRVTLDVSGKVVDARTLEAAVKIIFLHKNARSWLDILATKSARELPVHIGAGAINHTKTSAFAWRWELDAPEMPAGPALGLCARTISRADLPRRGRPPAPIPAHPAFIVHSFTRSALCPKSSTAS